MANWTSALDLIPGREAFVKPVFSNDYQQIIECETVN